MVNPLEEVVLWALQPGVLWHRIKQRAMLQLQIVYPLNVADLERWLHVQSKELDQLAP